jgi:hypothetical protein
MCDARYSCCNSHLGNTPLGKPGAYEFIGTAEQLAQFQSVAWMERDIVMTNAASAVCHVCGDQSLLEEYNRAKIMQWDTLVQSTNGLQPFRLVLALKLLEGVF